MNDRYLFRGKRIDNGEWVEGNLAGKDFICEKVVSIENKKTFSNRFDAVYIDMRCQYIDEDTIGQCTGLKDKNGKLIFEGDIVQVDLGEIFEGIVAWDEVCLWWCVKFEDGDEEPLAEWRSEIEVIGNKWDGPEAGE